MNHSKSLAHPGRATTPFRWRRKSAPAAAFCPVRPGERVVGYYALAMSSIGHETASSRLDGDYRTPFGEGRPVTGASGWIGSALVPESIDAGHEVVGLARSDASAEAVVASGAKAHPGALDDLDSLQAGAADSR
jgi:hypothetical protein